MKFIVIELQTNADGTVGNLVWAYDDRNQAESKYHTVLAAAAVSGLPCHAACLLASDGRLLSRECFEIPQVEESAPEETVSENAMGG